MSQIVKHNWNGHGIAQLKERTRIAKTDIPKGHVNATQMCQANGKQWGHYAERKSSKAYWEALSIDIGIPISSLIIQINAYGDEQGTWVHPEIAMDLAQWVSIPFRIWANRNLTKIVSGKVVELVQTKIDTLDPQSVLSQLNLAAEVMADLGIDSTIIGQLKLDAIALQLPAAKSMVEAGKKLLSSQEPLESIGLTPSDIASQLQPTLKPTEVNNILETLGLQYKHKRISSKSGKEKWEWQLTPQGLNHGHVYLTTGKQWSGGQIRWQASVVQLIQCHLDDSYERD